MYLVFFRVPRNSPITCTCGDPIPADVNITYTRTSIALLQSGALSNNIMQMILRQYLYFQHSTTRPSNSYTAVVTARVSDGQWMSDPATTTVTVEFTNLSPIVYIKGQVRIY